MKGNTIQRIKRAAVPAVGFLIIAVWFGIPIYAAIKRGGL